MRYFKTTAAALLAVFIVGCASEPSESQKESLSTDVRSTLRSMRAEDPGFGQFLDQAYAYVVFPSVGKGGLLVGGAFGRGEVYEQGRLIGYADITEATIGAQAGGEKFSEVICFRDRQALDNFTAGRFEPTAAASAVALTNGTARTAAYSNGVAIFTDTKNGLMAEAAVGGQKFTFVPLENGGRTTVNERTDINNRSDANTGSGTSYERTERTERIDRTDNNR